MRDLHVISIRPRENSESVFESSGSHLYYIMICVRYRRCVSNFEVIGGHSWAEDIAKRYDTIPATACFSRSRNPSNK